MKLTNPTMRSVRSPLGVSISRIQNSNSGGILSFFQQVGSEPWPRGGRFPPKWKNWPVNWIPAKEAPSWQRGEQAVGPYSPPARPDTRMLLAPSKPRSHVCWVPFASNNLVAEGKALGTESALVRIPVQIPGSARQVPEPCIIQLDEV